jgi:hypothetical protein
LEYFISLQGEGEKKTEAAPPVVVEETENEKYKRARKLYSLRMENLIKARLNQSQGNSTIASNTTKSNVQTSSPAAAQSPHQGGLDVHPEPGNLLKGIDNKIVRREVFTRLHPLFILNYQTINICLFHWIDETLNY